MANPGVSAAQHMDAIYRYQRYVYDATRKFYLLGRDRVIDELAPPPGGRVLEIACGTGRNLIAAARRYPGARFYGFDISTAMLDTARRQDPQGRPRRAHPRCRTPTRPTSRPSGCSARRPSTASSSPTRCR